MAFEHDKRYKKLFSNPILLKQLLTTFVDEEFVHKLDFSKIERLDKSFLTEEYKEKESDIIYKINYNNKDIYIYLLLEFQSTVDQNMVIRFGRYIYELNEVQTKLRKKNKKIPAVFPLLLYNGDDNWTAAISTRDIIEQSIPHKYIPNFEYYPIVINRISKETLLKFKNAVSAIFYVENSSVENLIVEFRNVIKQIEKEQPEIIQEFRRWLNNFLGNYNIEMNTQILEIQKESEMFAASIERLKVEERQKGRQEGIMQERKNSKIEMAKKMLKRKYAIIDISAITGLSEEKILELKAEN